MPAWFACGGVTFFPFYSKAEWEKKIPLVFTGQNPAFRFKRAGASNLRLLCQILVNQDEVVGQGIIFPDSEGIIIIPPQHRALNWIPVEIRILRLPKLERWPRIEANSFDVWVEVWKD